MSARPPAWRTGLFLLLMVALLSVSGYLGYRQLMAPVRTTPSCSPQTVVGSLTSAQVTVRVYNGGTKVGLAASIQKQLQAKGFQVPYVGNTTQVVVAATLVGGAVDAPEIKLVAGFFPQATVTADGRTDHTVDLLVGDSFAGFTDTAPTAIAVQSATICVASQKATPSPSVSPGASAPASVAASGVRPPTPAPTPTH